MMWVLSLFAIAAVERVLGSDYILVNKAMKWKEANKYCFDTYETRLAVIENDAQNADANFVRKGKTVWIGLTDFHQENIWTWPDLTKATYFNWDAGQPDNYKMCEDCAEMWKDHGKWNDADCNAARVFICDSPKPVYSENYIYLATPKSWVKANAWCQLKFKTTLAGIPNAIRNAEADKLRKGDTWFGLSDTVREGHWVNLDGTLQLWKHWAPNQPDNSGGHQDCALLWPNGVWDDQACTTEHAFLCNRRNPPPPPPIMTENYIYVPKKYTWNQANEFCKKEFSTTLAGIPNVARNNEAFNLRKLIGEPFWFGLNDIQEDRIWRNVDGTEVEWTWWKEGEPANDQKENCAQYMAEGNWADLNCGVKMHFLCNRHPPPPFKPIYTDNYIYVGLKRTWDEANDYCKSRFSTTLAGIPNKARNDELHELRNRKEVNQDIWFGLNDIHTEGKWVNEDGTLFMYKNWAPNEPNNGGGKGQDCGQMYKEGTWDDDFCHERKTFVCNRRKPRPPFFVYVGEAKKWKDANDYCKVKFGTSLAVVNSLEKNVEAAFMRDEAGKNVWIGLSDFKSESKWVWPDLKPSGWFNWAAGEPNNVGLCEDCTEIVGPDGKWNDLKCETARTFLCNAPAPLPEYTVGKKLIFVRHPMNWVSANAYCQTHFDTTLATIDGVDTNEEAKGFASSKIWFGFNDRGSEGKWGWANGDETKYTNWAPGEPNDAGRAEDCAEMYADGRWNDIPCYLHKEFVCNRPALPGPCNCWVNDGKQISCDSTPFAHLDKETGLYWTWASPCSGKCGGLVNPIPYGWRRATDEEFKTRPKDIAFFGYQDSMGQPVQSKDHPGVCSANIFDKVFNHCDSIDFKNGFVTNKDNNRVDETLLVHDSGKDCPKWAEREFVYLADLEKEVDVDEDDARTTVVVVGGQEYF